jgi:hypothetical protein
MSRCMYSCVSADGDSTAMHAPVHLVVWHASWNQLISNAWKPGPRVVNRLHVALPFCV